MNVKKLLQKIIENQRVSHMMIGLSSNKTVSISATWSWVTLPFDSIVEVTYRGKKVLVRINDAGPYHGNRIIDLSEAAAKKLGLKSSGTGRVTLRLVSCGNA